MKKLGVTLSDQELDEIFFESDLRRDKSLDFNEFVVSLAIGFILEEIPPVSPDLNELSQTTEQKKSFSQSDKLALDKAFNVIIDSYLMIDKDASGTISFQELKTSLSGDGASQFFSEERWKELDWDNDGVITFQEYLLAFEGWIGIEFNED